MRFATNGQTGMEPQWWVSAGIVSIVRDAIIGIITLRNRLAIVVGSRYDRAVIKGTTEKHEHIVVGYGGILSIAPAVGNVIITFHYRLAMESSGFVFFPLNLPQISTADGQTEGKRTQWSSSDGLITISQAV